MKKLQLTTIVVAAVSGIAALFATAAHAQSAPRIWVAPAAQKIRPQTQPSATAQSGATLRAAKNEFESFHVVVTGPASAVSMALPTLDDGRGHTISGRDIVLYREALIQVPQPSGGDGATGLWPDALIPDVDPIAGEKRNAFPFDVPAGESRAVFVDVHVPEGAPAGTYRGVVAVSGGAQAQVPVTLTVWDFAVPSTSTLRSAFTMSWNGPCRGHGDVDCSNEGGEAVLRMRYLQAALDNHITIDSIPIRPPVDANGVENWSVFDQIATPFLDGTAPTRLSGARLTTVKEENPNTAQAAAWGRHFTARGWHDKLYDYVCDEPPITCQFREIDERIARAKAGDPQLPTIVTTTSRDAQQNGVKSIDIFVPVVNWMDDKSEGGYAGSQRSNYGPNVWWYQSCMSFGCGGVGGAYTAGTALYQSGWPTMAIDADGTRNRAMEWLSFTYGISAELYYETTMAYFTGDPWANQYNFGGTGDGDLFYPGTPARIGGTTEIPVESLRMKMIRDGMEDYELLALARKLGLGDQATAIAKGVYPKTFQAFSTPEALEGARVELAKLILHAQGKDATTAVGPSGANLPASVAGMANPGDARGVIPHGGCASGGPECAWLALPLVALLALRRARRAAGG